MSFKGISGNKIVDGIIPKKGTVTTGRRRVVRHNQHITPVCVELPAAILGNREINTIEKVASGLGKDSFFYCLCLLMGAQHCLENGEEKMGRNFLDQAMTLGREKDFMNIIFFQLPSITEALCRKALEMGIDAEYVKNIIHGKIFPDRVTIEIDNRPWPVEIRTLGNFELSLNGKQVRFSGKTQRKPLLLLKALIALGGKDVEAGHLSDLLWPEADGDQAHSAFTTTLLRLRRFIGHDKVIMIHDGKASLNPEFCRIDLWGLEGVLGQAEDRLKVIGDALLEKNGAYEEIIGLAEKAISMCGGPFLPGEGNRSWIFPIRQRVQRRFLRLIIKAGIYLEGTDRCEKAVEFYYNALDTDEIVDEELYQRLMNCHHRLGQPAMAIEVYNRCRNTLLTTLGIRPSLKTEAIFRALIS